MRDRLCERHNSRVMTRIKPCHSERSSPIRLRIGGTVEEPRVPRKRDPLRPEGLENDNAFASISFNPVLGEVPMSRSNMFFALLLLIASVVTAAATACNGKSSQQPAIMQAAQASPVKRYQLKGKVVSIDKQAKMANIDAEAIPGFMDAMTMPYPIKPETDLDKLQPGDVVTGDVVVQDDNSWLENVVVTGHAASSQK